MGKLRPREYKGGLPGLRWDPTVHTRSGLVSAHRAQLAPASVPVSPGPQVATPPSLGLRVICHPRGTYWALLTFTVNFGAVIWPGEQHPAARGPSSHLVAGCAGALPPCSHVPASPFCSCHLVLEFNCGLRASSQLSVLCQTRVIWGRGGQGLRGKEGGAAVPGKPPLPSGGCQKQSDAPPLVGMGLWEEGGFSVSPSPLIWGACPPSTPAGRISGYHDF